MARAPKDPAHYDELREVSGWYLSAWRSFRNLTLQDLAAEMETSRGQVSDLENGATNSKARDVAAGDLIDTNPYSSEPRYRSTGADILATWADIPEESRAQALKVLESFKRTGTEG
jgi:transcriptional regulator with XRE-family HTH domain